VIDARPSVRRCVLTLALSILLGGLVAASARAAPQSPPPPAPQASGAAFDQNGMWIWYVAKAGGGDPGRIAARAKAHGIGTVFIKAGDGTGSWSQFTPQLVTALERRGLSVCAWVFVYGSNPVGEARVSAEAVRRGAECLVIDAEAHYEGRYAQASAYISRLRASVGPDYPLGLASFPYVHYHPAFPYSVFLGPGGAEFNLPQAYWRAIGTTVDKVIAITYTYNRVYERSIDPLGQLYGNPPRREVLRFRKLSLASGFGGVSWWSWQHATARGFAAAGKGPLRAPRDYVPATTYPILDAGAAGDLVVWAQQHLIDGRYLRSAVTGKFGGQTERAVENFQLDAGLPVTGVLDAATWPVLLDRLDPAPIAWRPAGPARPRARGDAVAMAPPASAKLPAVANEISRRRGAPGPHR
jgi:peptidoglycan hydrolase-like protein with peptidoglycan-binding domain